MSKMNIEPRYTLHTDRLPNGLHLMHYQTKGSVAYAALLIGVGSRDELPNEWGISHLVEHMLFKGTQRRSAYQISSRLEEVGGELNAYTAKEETVIYATILPKYLGRALELIADVACHTSFPEKELAKEKEVILEEIASYTDAPAELIYDEFEELAFAGHPLAHSILGSKQSVRAIDREALLRYMQRLYVAPRMAIATSGPFPFAQVQQLAHNLFGQISAGSTPQARVPFSGTPTCCKTLRRRTAQRHCLVGAHTLPMGDERSITIALLANILGGYASTSRLYRAMRERAGIAYTVECTSTAYADTGLFTVYFGTDAMRTTHAFSILQRELDRIRTRPLSPRALQRVKQQSVGQIHIAAENIEGNLLQNARRLVEQLPLIDLSSTIREINAVTSEDLLWAAQTFLADDKLFTLIYK